MEAEHQFLSNLSSTLCKTRCTRDSAGSGLFMNNHCGLENDVVH